MKYLSRFLLWLTKPFIFMYDIFHTDQFRKFIIKKGRHRSCLRFKPVYIEEGMGFVARFNYSAQYKTIDPVNQWDINKLWGFSEYLFSDKVNSARIGWNYREGKLYLRPFTHVNGKMSMDPPEIEVKMDQDIPCLIIVQPEEYIFYIGAERVKMPRAKGPTSFMGVQLYPFFGGDEVAPQTISIQVKS